MLSLLLTLALAQTPPAEQPEAPADEGRTLGAGEEPGDAEEPPIPEDLPILSGPSIVPESYVEAVYPEAEKAQGVEATVVLSIELSAEG